jgi:hypothetical protein
VEQGDCWLQGVPFVPPVDPLLDEELEPPPAPPIPADPDDELPLPLDAEDDEDDDSPPLPLDAPDEVEDTGMVPFSSRLHATNQKAPNVGIKREEMIFLREGCIAIF